MELSEAQIESILAGVLLNGQPLTIPEIRIITRALKVYLRTEVLDSELREGYRLFEGMNDILITRG